MEFITLYFAVAFVLVPLISVAAAWLGHDHPQSRTSRWFYSLIAGLLWPLLIAGLVQFLAIIAARQVARARRTPAESALLGVTLPDVTGSLRSPWTAAH